MAEYFYLTADNQRIGPFSLEELMAKSITAQTLIWREGLAQWTSAMQVPEVAALLTNTPPPVPPAPNENPGYSGKPTYGPYDSTQPLPECPENYLIWSILSTIFCCLPFGIVAIYESSQVEKFYYRKEYEKAQKAANRAKNWCWASFLSVILIWVLYFGALLLGVFVSIY